MTTVMAGLRLALLRSWSIGKVDVKEHLCMRPFHKTCLPLSDHRIHGSRWVMYLQASYGPRHFRASTLAVRIPAPPRVGLSAHPRAARARPRAPARVPARPCARLRARSSARAPALPRARVQQTTTS